MFTKAGYAVARAALTIEQGKTPGADVKALEKAKDIYHEAYLRNTWIGAGEQHGLHNPPEAMRVLGDALDQGRQAEIIAREDPQRPRERQRISTWPRSTRS